MNNSVNELGLSTAARLALSSLMDGDRQAGDTEMAFAAWRQDAESRSVWHVYHLIGDVLRSDDLASTPERDAAFLVSLRGRLALEPVPLAPLQADSASTPSVRAGRRAAGWWVAPAAVAAGFVAVAGLLVVTRVLSPDPADRAQLAQARTAGSARLSQAAAGEALRNAGLDRYLEAHRSLANGVVAAGGAEHRVQIVFEAQ